MQPKIKKKKERKKEKRELDALEPSCQVILMQLHPHPWFYTPNITGKGSPQDESPSLGLSSLEGFYHTHPRILTNLQVIEHFCSRAQNLKVKQAIVGTDSNWLSTDKPLLHSGP